MITGLKHKYVKNLFTKLTLTASIFIAVSIPQMLLATQTHVTKILAPLAVGDIIFIKSQTQQSAALREATGSDWTHVGIVVQKNNAWVVAEAVGPLKFTPLNSFIARSKNQAYKVLRYKFFNPKTMTTALLNTLSKYNKPYDIYFEFTDERIYCSELTYKVLQEVTGQELGRVQKMKEMHLDGPYVKALIKKRFTDTGRTLDPEEEIITPVSQINDPDLALVRSSANTR